MINRLIRWTTSSLPAAFVATAILGALFSIVFWIAISGWTEPRPGGDSSFGGSAEMIPWVLLAFALTVGIIGLGLAIFGVLPTLWLRRFHDRWWTWLIVVAWGGASGMTLILLLTGQISRDVAWATFVCGAVCGLLWRTLAAHVLRRQSEEGAFS